jgi:hypothetical protein
MTATKKSIVVKEKTVKKEAFKEDFITRVLKQLKLTKRKNMFIIQIPISESTI